MLNRVILMGRITQDLDLRQTPTGVSVLTFTIAVDRGYAKQGEERQTDFITCVAWRQQAEFISRYFAKGRMIAVEGNLRTRTYDDKNGTKHYVTEVYVDNVSFTGEAKQGGNTYNAGYSNNASNNYSQPQQPAYNNAPAKDSIAIGDFSDFEEVLSDDGVPF
jgi:single-strand DNA-binding protein